MVNYESGPSNVESSSDDSTSTTKEKTSKDKRSLRVLLEAPARAKETLREDAPKPAAPFEFASRKSDKAENADDVPETETDKPEVTDAELEHVTVEDDHYAIPKIAEEHRIALEQTDEATRAEVEPAINFLKKVENDIDPTVALREELAELGLSDEEIAEAIAESPIEDAEDASSEDAIDEAPVVAEHVFDPNEDDEGEVDLSGATAGSSGSSGGGGASSGGTTPPPAPPTGSTGPTGTGGGAGATTATFNAAPLPPTPNVMPEAANTYYSQRRRAGELLVVGIVAYLYGRRKGRIKTEKRLAPVQRRLEKRVSHLEQDITLKEQQLVAAKARMTERQKPLARPEGPQRPAIERTQPGRKETRLGMEKPVRAERLGHMIVAAEAPKAAERSRVERPNNIREAFRAEEVKTMQRAELLELSEKIIIEGASLRKIYESRLIGEKQLRHLISEYLQGKDIRKALRQEMVEHEIDFERDPILRDRVRSHLSTNQSGGGLGDLLAKAGFTEESVDPALQQRIEHEQQRRTEQEKRQHRQRVVADSAMVTAVVVLAVTVMILVLTR